MGGGVAADTDQVDQAVGPLIAEGLERAEALSSGRARCLEVLLRSPAQLNDPRGAGRDRQQAAAHRGEQNRHAHRQIPLPAEEVDGGGVGVLHDEHQQQDQDQETDDQR